MKQTLEKRRHVLAQKIALDPKSGQETYFHQVPGVARFTVRYRLAASTSCIKRDASLEVGGDQEFVTNSNYPLGEALKNCFTVCSLRVSYEPWRAGGVRHGGFNGLRRA